MEVSIIMLTKIKLKKRDRNFCLFSYSLVNTRLKFPMPAEQGYLKYKSVKTTLDLRKDLQL